MNRRCNHCEQSIIAVDRSDSFVSPADDYAAWLAGYCTPMCQRNAALEAVSSGRAWWLRPQKLPSKEYERSPVVWSDDEIANWLKRVNSGEGER